MPLLVAGALLLTDDVTAAVSVMRAVNLAFLALALWAFFGILRLERSEHLGPGLLIAIAWSASTLDLVRVCMSEIPYLGISLAAIYALLRVEAINYQDPNMLVLCPLHLSLYEKDGITHVGFTRPTHVGEGSDAMPLLKEIETVLSNAVVQAISRVNNNSSVLPPQGDKRDIGNQGQPHKHQHKEGDSRPEQ